MPMLARYSFSGAKSGLRAAAGIFQSSMLRSGLGFSMNSVMRFLSSIFIMPKPEASRRFTAVVAIVTSAPLATCALKNACKSMW